MKVLLTSAGFENKKISDIFLKLIGKCVEDSRVVFIPTAADTAESVAMLPKCMNDLLNIGIRASNIMVYDLHFKFKYRDLKEYDAVYLCGGSAEYLIERVNKSGFRKEILRYIKQDGVYVGVSAGSCIASNNVRNNLGIIAKTLNVHCDKGEMAGPLNPEKEYVNLTNKQSVLIHGNEISIIE